MQFRRAGLAVLVASRFSPAPPHRGIDHLSFLRCGCRSRNFFESGFTRCFQYWGLRRIRRRVEIFDWRDGRSFELGRCYEFNRRIDQSFIRLPNHRRINHWSFFRRGCRRRNFFESGFICGFQYRTAQGNSVPGRNLRLARRRSFELGRCCEFNRRIDQSFAPAPPPSPYQPLEFRRCGCRRRNFFESGFICGFQYPGLRKIRRRVEIFDWRNGRSFELGRCCEFNRRIDQSTGVGPALRDNRKLAFRNVQWRNLEKSALLVRHVRRHRVALLGRRVSRLGSHD